MRLVKNKLEELRILPFLLYFVLIMLLVNICGSIINAIVNPEFNMGLSAIGVILIRLLFFFILIYIFIQIKLLMKNKFNNRVMLIKFINRFRILGLLFIAWDLIKFGYWFIITFNDYKHLLLSVSNMGWNHAVYGIVFLSLAEIIYIAAKIKEENDLTV